MPRNLISSVAALPEHEALVQQARILFGGSMPGGEPVHPAVKTSYVFFESNAKVRRRREAVLREEPFEQSFVQIDDATEVEKVRIACGYTPEQINGLICTIGVFVW